jgi:hypothetical protein
MKQTIATASDSSPTSRPVLLQAELFHREKEAIPSGPILIIRTFRLFYAKNSIVLSVYVP